MKRRLFTIFAAFSLLLFVAVCVLWVRSYFVGDRFCWSSFREEGAYTLWTQDMVVIGGGGVGFKRSVQGGLRPWWRHTIVAGVMRSGGPPPFHERLKPDSRIFSTDTVGTRLGFKWRRFEVRPAGAGPARGYHVVVPFWAVLLSLVATFGVPLMARHVVRMRRKRHGLCAACGYDLRATPGRCPECGLFPAAPPP